MITYDDVGRYSICTLSKSVLFLLQKRTRRALGKILKPLLVRNFRKNPKKFELQYFLQDLAWEKNYFS